MRPRVFIASSSEHIELARAIQVALDTDFETRVWDEEVVKPSSYVLPSLEKEAKRTDYSVFVFAPDDIARIRGKRLNVVRDNVIFEAGLFAGHHGHENIFIVVPRGAPRTHLPSDFGGFTWVDYRLPQGSGNLVAALGSACSKLRTTIRESWKSRYKNRTGLSRSGMFTDFIGDTFEGHFASAKAVKTYFIHSRRWREDHSGHLRMFLSRPGTRMTVYLPDLFNVDLVRVLMGHFEGDGPELPRFIANAYRWYAELQRGYGKRVVVRLFEVYPTYSFYKFDDRCVVALYPTTPFRHDVPTFEVDAESRFGEFVAQDIDVLEKRCRTLSSRDLRKVDRVVDTYLRAR